MSGVGTGISDQIQRGRCDPVAFNANLITDGRGMTSARAGEFLLAGVLHAHWLPGCQGEMSAEVFN